MIAPMKVVGAAIVDDELQPTVTLDDALRFAEERVEEFHRLTRDYGFGLEAELANTAYLQHHPHHPLTEGRKALEDGGGGGDEGARSCGSPGSRQPSATPAAPSHYDPTAWADPDLDGEIR